MASIAYLINRYPSPSHTFIRREVAALEAAGLEIHRFSHRSTESTWLDPSAYAERDRTQVLTRQGVTATATSIIATALRHPIRFVDALLTAISMGFRAHRVLVNMGYLVLACVLGREIARCRATHIHAHFGTNPAAVALLCSGLFGIRFSFTVHGPEEFEAAERLSLERKVAAAEFVVAVSAYGQRELRRRYPADAGRIHLVRCGLDASWFDRPPAPIPAAPRLLSVARLDEQKDPLLLIRAAAELREQGEALHLTIAGDGPLRSVVEREIDQRRLHDCITLLGWQSQDRIVTHLRESRAVILSSRAEGLPVAIMEAFAMGRPVIATDVGGVSELVEAGATGWLIAAGDARALVTAMKQALEATSVDLAKMAAAGRARVAEHHDVRKSAAILATLLSGH